MTGWKDWAILEVVTEPEFQSFIQDQVVQRYANPTERDTTLGANVANGMVAYVISLAQLQVYNGTDWVASFDSSGIEITASQITDVTASAAEINILDGVTATATELNVVDGITATTAELNFTDGVTSAIQTQIDGKVSKTNGEVTTATTSDGVVRNIYVNTSGPTGGIDGDVWLVFTP